MSWVLAIGLALAAFLVLVFFLKVPRSGWEATGAALLLGIAGYGLQASPGLDGAPKPAAQKIASDPGALVKARGSVSESELPPNNKWVVIADGMARNGQFANAAQVLLGAVEDNPQNGEAWLALANALVSHAEGILTPASLYAFQKASNADPEHPGPPFFLGLAMAQSGRFGEAKALWSELLDRTPEDAPWRENLEMQLGRLDDILAQQEGVQTGR
ncbi:MAG: cytochrome C biosynthesis protein [Novosphingobium sp.]|nr:cytochrome C biosynthesis protein [Novosphingobium sp.]